MDTVNLTIHLLLHRIEVLWEILDSIHRSQRRTSTMEWREVLGKLRSISITLRGSRNMFKCLQNALSKGSKTRIDLNKGVHQALDDFRWIAKDLTSRPTCLAKLIPLALVAESHHDMSGQGAGGV